MTRNVPLLKVIFIDLINMNSFKGKSCSLEQQLTLSSSWNYCTCLLPFFLSNHTEIRETEAACAISSFYSLVSTCTRFILPVLTSKLHSARRMTHHFKHTSEFLGYDHPPSAVAMVPTHTHTHTNKHTHTAKHTTKVYCSAMKSGLLARRGSCVNSGWSLRSRVHTLS